MSKFLPFQRVVTPRGYAEVVGPRGPTFPHNQCTIVRFSDGLVLWYDNKNIHSAEGCCCRAERDSRRRQADEGR